MGMFTFTTDDVEVAEAVLALIGGEEPAAKAPSKPVKAPKASAKVEEPEDDDEDPEEYSEATLKKMPIAELREVAEEFEIDSKGLKKPDLIEAILDAQEEDLDPVEDEDADDLDDEDDLDEDDLEDEEDEPPVRKTRRTRR